jgi:hypothetical protein
MTQQQEQWRLRELETVAPVLANGDLWPLTSAAMQVAVDLRECGQDCGQAAVLGVMYRVALDRLGHHLFTRLLCTPLCSVEPPDTAGAEVLVQVALRGDLYLEPRRIKPRKR